MPRVLRHPVMIHLAGGTYYLPETLVLAAEDSAVTWTAAKGQTPVISGGVKLDLTWEPYKDGILQAKVPQDLVSEELFVNGERQILARYPNYDPQAEYFDGFAADAIGKEREARWADPRGGYFHAMHPAMWGGFTWRITGKDAARRDYQGGRLAEQPRRRSPSDGPLRGEHLRGARLAGRVVPQSQDPYSLLLPARRPGPVQGHGRGDASDRARRTPRYAGEARAIGRA